MIKPLILTLLLGVGVVSGEDRTFKVTFYCSCPKCTGKYSPTFGGLGNTATGHAPIPFRTVAVGDPALLGKWIYFEDLGGWVLASDTGAPCTLPQTRKSHPTLVVGGVLSSNTSNERTRKSLWIHQSSSASPGCVAKNQIDVYVGGREMHQNALRLGVQEWIGRIR